MHSSSADTSYTFGDNTVPVADGGNQSSPGTGDSGTAMEWNNISSRGRSSASNRSSRATSKRDQQHRGQRTSRRSTTRSATPKATHDRPSRTGETSGKHPRRTGDSSRIEAKTASIMHTMRSWNIKATMRSNSCRITYWRNK